LLIQLLKLVCRLTWLFSGFFSRFLCFIVGVGGLFSEFLIEASNIFSFCGSVESMRKYSVKLYYCKIILLFYICVMKEKINKPVIINARGTAVLKEAIRIVAFNAGHSNSSRLIVNILESDPRIAAELERLRRGSR
jgi:hypothetical protein